jgi:hypothetical protein
MKNVFDRMAQEDDASYRSAAPEAELPIDGKADTNTCDEPFRTSPEVRELTQQLLKHGYLEEAQGAEAFRRVTIHESAINTALEPLDLMLRLDSHRGVAYLAVVQVACQDSNVDEGWTHPLVRRLRLTLEQSLLVALLRQAFVIHEQEAGVGHSAATIAVDELLPQFLVYFGDSGSDARNESRLLSVLDQLKTYGVVSEVDNKQEVVIRPLIAHVANPESLAALLRVLKEQRPSEAMQEHKDQC